MNKGRDYHRALQAKCNYLARRTFYPRPLDEDNVAFALSDRAYKKTNAKNKVYTFTGVDGKEHSIPYQTCTFVRIRPRGVTV
jgi:hypothetical protein